MGEHGKRFDDTLIGRIVKLWPLVSAFILLFFTAVMMYAKVDRHDELLKQNSLDHRLYDERISRLEAISEDLKEIKILIRHRNQE